MRYFKTASPHKRPGRRAKVARQERAFDRLIEQQRHLQGDGVTPQPLNSHAGKRLARIALDISRLRAQGIDEIGGRT